MGHLLLRGIEQVEVAGAVAGPHPDQQQAAIAGTRGDAHGLAGERGLQAPVLARLGRRIVEEQVAVPAIHHLCADRDRGAVAMDDRQRVGPRVMQHRGARVAGRVPGDDAVGAVIPAAHLQVDEPVVRREPQGNLDPLAAVLVVDQAPVRARGLAVIKLAGVVHVGTVCQPHLAAVVGDEARAPHRRPCQGGPAAAVHIQPLGTGERLVAHQRPDRNHRMAIIPGQPVDQERGHVLDLLRLDPGTGTVALYPEPDQQVGLTAIGFEREDLSGWLWLVEHAELLGEPGEHAVVADPFESVHMRVAPGPEHSDDLEVGAPEQRQCGTVLQRHGGRVVLPGRRDLDLVELILADELPQVHRRDRRQ